MSEENLNCEKTTKDNCTKSCPSKSGICNYICPLVLLIVILFISILIFMYPPWEEEPFLSSYIEALGDQQTVAQNANVIFDVESIDDVGNNITLGQSGTIFTINEPGLYLIEWDVNLSSTSSPAVLGILENGEPASGAASSAAGNLSSGTLIYVDTIPFTISLHNYGNEITLENYVQFEDSAASIRITRFADGPSE